jgi:MFS family permease
MMQLKGSALFAAVVTVTSLGFFQIGFDNGALGSLITTTAFNNTFNKPGPTIVGLLVAILEVGAFFGSIATSFVGEGLGRRKSIAIGVVIMMLGSLLSATSFGRAQLLVARIVAGFGLGVVNSTAPVLLAEFAPKATLNFATAFVYWMGYAFSFHTGSFAWRVPIILQFIFLTPMLLILLVIPETPRWLVAHGRPDEALAVLRRLHHTGKVSEEEVLKIHADIVRTVAVEESIGAGTWKDLLRDDQIHSRRRLLIACSIQIFQQLGGINAVRASRLVNVKRVLILLAYRSSTILRPYSRIASALTNTSAASWLASYRHGSSWRLSYHGS